MNPKERTPFVSQDSCGTEMYHQDRLAPYYVRIRRETNWNPEENQLHSHPFLELAWVKACPEGEYVIGECCYSLCPGDILIIPPGTLHGVRRTETLRASWVRDVVWISPHLLNRMDQTHPNRRFYETGDTRLLRTQGTSWAFLGELFSKGIEEWEAQRFGWEGMVLACGMQLLTQVTRAMLDRSLLVLREEKSDLLMGIVNHLEQHLGEKITLESVAQEFDVSKSTVTQLFRKRLDMSFYVYLTRRRLIHARGLIEAGGPLEQVGKQVGFKEHSAFYRAFRQEYGISPRDYKNSLRENTGSDAQNKNL